MEEQLNKKTLLIESQYFPSVYFYKTLINYDILLLEKYEHYQKLSYRNRCYIAGPNGGILLSVPLLKGKNQRTVMKDVKISNEEKWQSLHWKTLVSAYRRSPWFEYFEDELQHLYERPFEYLLDWNIACLEWTHGALGYNMPVTFTQTFEKQYSTPGIIDARDQMRPAQIPRDASLPEYTQVFQDRTGFLPNMSILDLLFCEGKHSLDVLKD